MNQNLRKYLLALCLCTVMGQVFANYQIRKHSINSGGGEVSNGTYTLRSSIGQTDASDKLSGSGVYTLNGGYWHEIRQPRPDLIFDNGFE